MAVGAAIQRVDGYEVTGRQSRYHGSHLVVLLACSNLSR